LPAEFYAMLISSMMKNYIVLNPTYKRSLVIGGYMSYAKSIHPENTFPWYIPCQQLKPTFLATCLMAVLQLSGYSIFHGGDTPI